MWCAKQCLTRVFFFCSGLTGIFQTYIPLSVSWRNSGSWRYGSGATERYWKVLKGTERYWKLRCVLLSINSTNGVNRQCVPSSDSSIWNNPPDIKANDITVACNDLSVLGLRCQLRCCILFSPHSSVRTVYVLILPFALIELGHLMPVAVTVTAWALLSIEDGQLLDMSETIAFVQSTSRLQDQPAIQVVDVLAQTGSDTVHRSQMMVS